MIFDRKDKEAAKVKQVKKLPTKQQMVDYMNEDKRTHTRYSASIHFNIAIEDVYRILE